MNHLSSLTRLLSVMSHVVRSGIIVLPLMWISLDVALGQVVGDEVAGVSWSPDGSKIAIAGGSTGCDPNRFDDYAVRILDVATRQITAHFEGHSCRLVDVAWSPDGSRIVTSGFANSETFVWDASNGTLLVTGKFQVETGVGVVWSPDSTRIASIGSGGKYAFVWDAATGTILYSLPEHADFTTSVAWNQDGTKIATSSLDNTVQIWDTATQQNVMTLHHSTAVHWVVWSSDGRLATASDDGSVQIWNAITGDAIYTLQSHTASAEVVSWSSDGKWVASGSLDGTVRIWDTTAGQLVEIIESNSGPIVDLVWSPVGNEVAYIGRNATSVTIEAPPISFDVPTPTADPGGNTPRAQGMRGC